MYRSPFRAKARQTTVFKQPGKWAAGYHTGEDWVCDSDRTLVSPCDGTILVNGYDKSYGYNVIIRTQDNKVIRMCHMARKSTAHGTVKAGNAIGIMGNSGNSYGAHLHIEVQNSKNWVYNKNLLKPSSYIDFNEFDAEDEEMTQEEFNKMFAKTYNKENPLYKNYNDIPDWGKPAVKYYMDSGKLIGTDSGLNLRNDVLRGLVIACPKIYNTVAECPEFARPTIQKLIDEEALKGEENNKLALTLEMIRVLIIMERSRA